MATKKTSALPADFEAVPADFEPAEPNAPSGLQAAVGSGAAKFVLPMLGGMGGGLGGAAGGAALGTMIAPGPGTVIGGIAGGMLGAGGGTAAAEAGREMVAGEQLDPRNIAMQGVIAAATEPLGMILGPGINAATKKFGGVRGLAAAGKRFLAGVSDDIEKRFPGAIYKIEQLNVSHGGVRQVDQQMSAIAANSKQVINAASIRGVKASPLDLLQPMKEAIAQLDTAGSPAGNLLIKRTEAFLKKLGSPNLSPNRIQKIKQFHQDKADALWAQQAQRGASGKPLKRIGGKTATQIYHESIARGAKEWLEQNVPEVVPFNEEMRALIGAKQALNSPASRTNRRSMARFTTSAIAASLPNAVVPRVGAGVIGYGVGHMAEPLITPTLGAAFNAAQSPLVYQGLGQLPRAAGLGFNQALSDR